MERSLTQDVNDLLDRLEERHRQHKALMDWFMRRRNYARREARRLRKTCVPYKDWASVPKPE